VLILTLAEANPAQSTLSRRLLGPSS
jgi:hypothetical protein